MEKSAIILLILIVVVVNGEYNMNNFFPNFDCGIVKTIIEARHTQYGAYEQVEVIQNTEEEIPKENQTCIVRNVLSYDELVADFSNLEEQKFDYYVTNTANTGNNYCDRDYISYGHCYQARSSLKFYPVLVFEHCEFHKFPPGEFDKLESIEEISAQNVGLSELNRDDLKSFKCLQVLDLSRNQLTSLGGLIFLYLPALRTLKFDNNHIESIDAMAFDNSNVNLTVIDLSNNRLKEISESILNALGKRGDVELLLRNNSISAISKAASSSLSERSFRKIDMAQNQLTNFVFNCTHIDTLDLNENQLEEFAIGHCTVGSLSLESNNLINLSVGNLSALKISNNVRLQNLTLNVNDLTTLKIENLPAKILSYDTLKQAKKLKTLSVAGTFLGAPQINTFAAMKALKSLNLSRSGLAHIEYGMFSHQKSVEIFDISDNNLASIDINMLTTMKNLKIFSVKGNNLTHLDHAESIKKTFPLLEEVRIDENLWNCSYLANLMKIFMTDFVTVAQPMTYITDVSNMEGIECVKAPQAKITPVDSGESVDAVKDKLNQIIVQINDESVRRENFKFDVDVMRAEIFGIHKEILELKSKMVTNQLEMKAAGGEKSGSSVDMNEIKAMMEQLNKLALERQKLANDQLLVKISELQNQITKSNIEHENFVQRKHLPELISKSEGQSQQKVENAQSGDDTKTLDILLTIVITSLVIATIAYGYSKLKQKVDKYNDLLSVRARSTNTLNTTIEFPMGNGGN